MAKIPEDDIGRQAKGRERGRPKGFNRPDVPWQEVDRLIVHGELIRREATGEEHFRYPTYQQLADRYGCSKTLIGKYAGSHRCLERRKKAQRAGDAGAPVVTTVGASPGTVESLDEQLDRDRVLATKGKPLSLQDNLDIVDACLREFARALDEGRFRCDSPGDLKSLLQLREKLDEDRRESSAEPEITLAQIQARHRGLLDEIAGFDPWLTGEVVEDE